jgi:hypothetical protein
MAKVEGLDRLQRKFAAMPRAVRQEVGKALEDSARELTGLQKRLAPHGATGGLEDSILYEIDGLRATVTAGGTAATKREAREGSGVELDVALMEEFGVKAHRAGGKFEGALIPAIPPRPFFFPAYRALRKRIKGRLSRAIRTGIAKAARGG